MKNPTHKELMEFVDGTLVPQRFREIDILISQSRHLQREVAMLREMRKVIHNGPAVSPSKKFTAGVMNEILPVQQASFWFRIAKNSSNLFAMILVLSLIGIVLVSGPAGQKNETNLLKKSFESYSSVYNSAVESMSGWTTRYAQPVGELTKSHSGKFMLIGIAAFFIVMAVDELIAKKFFHARIKP